MAALVCDICGGKLVMGSGGVAVCDSCGMEYSTERMREKVQAIKGTVQIDNSNMVGTWMKMAQSASEAGNQKEAYDYYAKVLEVEPSNWRALFGKGKAAAWQSTLANSRTSELYQAVKMSIGIIEHSDMTADEIASAKNEFAVAIYNVNNAFLDLRKANFDRHDDKYYDMHWDEWWEVHYTQGTENVRQTEDVMTLIDGLDDDLSKSNVLEMKKHICDVLVHICDCSDTYWDSYSKNYLQCFGLNESTKKPFVDKYLSLVAEIRETEPNYKTTKYSQIDPWSPPVRWDSNRSDKIHQYWQDKDHEIEELRKKKLAEKRHTAYWEEHAAEKQQYLSRISEIDSELAGLYEQSELFESKISAIREDLTKELPIQLQLAAIRRQQSDLRNQKAKLGLFSGKQRKQLQEQIDSLQSQVNSCEETIKRQKAEIQADVFERIAIVESERKPTKERIEQLEREKSSIQAELSKER